MLQFSHVGRSSSIAVLSRTPTLALRVAIGWHDTGRVAANRAGLAFAPAIDPRNGEDACRHDGPRQALGHDVAERIALQQMRARDDDERDGDDDQKARINLALSTPIPLFDVRLYPNAVDRPPVSGFARDRRAGAADEEIEIDALVRLLHHPQ